MELTVFDSYNKLSEFAAEQILRTIKSKPDAVLCLATGESPKLTYNLLVRKVTEQKIDLKKVHFVALDEWIGIPSTNPGSCHYFLNENLFSPLGITKNIHLFDAFAFDYSRECEKMNEVIRHLGGIDLMLVGVGMNGHIGFNEPGTSETLYAHVQDLDSITSQVGQKYFAEKMELKKGITLGLRHFFEARHVIVLANGKKKSLIIKKALEEAISTQVPASLVRNHSHAQVLIDQEAASELTQKN